MTYYAHINSHNELTGMDVSRLIADEYGSENVQNIEVTEAMYNNAQEYGINYYMYDNGAVVLNPSYEDEQAAARQAEFLKEFFNTSLGYIRRAVTMADGSHKDFLSDLLPVISMGVQAGQAVNIIAYTMPDFSEPVTDWTQYQHIEAVTPQFIQECFLQLQNDFVPNLEE